MNNFNGFTPYPYGIPPQTPMYPQYVPNSNPNPNPNPSPNFYDYVNGREGAKAYRVLPNQKVLLMDSDNPIFYLKQANMNGQTSIRAFRFEEIQDNVESASQQYVSIADFNALKNQVNELLKAKEDKPNA